MSCAYPTCVLQEEMLLLVQSYFLLYQNFPFNIVILDLHSSYQFATIFNYLIMKYFSDYLVGYIIIRFTQDTRHIQIINEHIII